MPPLSEADTCRKRIVAVMRCQDSETAAELDALLPAILDRAFKGDL
jgi:hypothetical protein